MARQPAFICHNRHGTYYFRGIIPIQLRPFLRHQREVRVSLRTDSRKQAIIAARAARVGFDRAIGRLGEMDKNNVESYYEKLKDEINIAVRYVRTKNPERAAKLSADEALDIADKLRRKHSSDLQQIHAELDAPAAPTPTAPAAPAAPTLTAPTAPTPAPSAPAPTLSDMAEVALEEEKRNKKQKLGRRGRYYAAAPKFFKFIIGDLPVDQISYEMVEEFYHKLKDVPALLFQASQKYKHIQSWKDIEEITIEPGKEVSYDARKKYVQTIKAILDAAKKRKHITVNVAENFKLESDFSERPDNEKREPFNEQELKTIFDRPYFTKPYSEHDTKEQTFFWMFILALYTGARLSDLLYLGPESIKQTSADAWYLDLRNVVNKDGNLIRMVKGKTSRQSPLHSVILKLGFLDYVNTRKQSMYLFEQVTILSEKISKKMSSEMTARLKQWGVHQPGIKTFHSFRHTLTTHATNDKGIDIKTVSSLTGHITGQEVKKLTSEKVYLDNKPVQFIKEEVVDKLAYGLQIERTP